MSVRSTSRQAAIWRLEPHTAAKHELLRGYLNAWFPVLARYNGRIIVLDGFAGPGVYAGGEPGSPAIALDALINHAYLPAMPNTQFVFFFNEVDTIRYQSLEAVVKGYQDAHSPWPKNVVVEVANDDFTSVARDILDGLGDKKLAPTFAFLDPFGYRDVPIRLIAELTKFDRSELFIYFDYNSVMRFSTAGNVDEHFEALFGTDEFKNAPAAGDPQRGPFLRDLYRRQLEQVCGFKYVRFFEMVNAQGRTGHYMFFCTRHRLGLEKMKDVMWKVDPINGNRFSDVLAGQSVLFQDEVDVEPLRETLLARFRGQTVTIETLEDFVLIETPYRKTHLKTKTLKPMQKAQQISFPNPTRTGQYPPGTLITFPI